MHIWRGSCLSAMRLCGIARATLYQRCKLLCRLSWAMTTSSGIGFASSRFCLFFGEVSVAMSTQSRNPSVPRSVARSLCLSFSLFLSLSLSLFTTPVSSLGFLILTIYLILIYVYIYIYISLSLSLSVRVDSRSKVHPMVP